MQIHRLDLSRPADLRRFNRFPFQLYQNCPQWVPPLHSEARSLPKHPFFQHSAGEFYLAEQGRQVVGRIAVLHNTRHNTYQHRKTAFFGFFDCVKDSQAARELFSAAFEWASQRGLEEIIGPRGLVGSDSGGVLVEGFHLRPALGVPYNHEYYDLLLREAGFQKDTDHLSGYLPGAHQLPERLEHAAELVRRRGRLRIQGFASTREMRPWIPRVSAAHQRAFNQNHEYFPPSEAEVQLIANSLISVADPRLIKLVLSGDEVVGFILAYHDISPALQRCKGRIWTLGWYHILQERKRAEWVNINGVGLLPEYRGMGGNALLYSELSRSIHAVGFKHMEIIQVDETNHTSRSDMEAIGVKWYKRHRNHKRTL